MPRQLAAVASEPLLQPAAEVVQKHRFGMLAGRCPGLAGLLDHGLLGGTEGPRHERTVNRPDHALLEQTSAALSPLELRPRRL